MNDIFNPQAPTMTSRQIADMCQKDHKNVLRTIEFLQSEGCLHGEHTPYIHAQNGQAYIQWVFDKENSIVLVARLDPKYMKDIIVRWQELEAQVKQPEPQLEQPEQRVPTPIEVEENTAALKRMAADEEFKAQFPLIYQSVLDGAQNTMLAFVGMAPLLIGGAAKPKDVAEIAKAAKLSIPANLKSSAGKFVKQRYKGEPSIVERIINGSIREAHAYTDHAQVEGLIKLYLESKNAN
jgi:phage regulator Rha-like protein